MRGGVGSLKAKDRHRKLLESTLGRMNLEDLFLVAAHSISGDPCSDDALCHRFEVLSSPFVSLFRRRHNKSPSSRQADEAVLIASHSHPRQTKLQRHASDI